MWKLGKFLLSIAWIVWLNIWLVGYGLLWYTWQYWVFVIVFLILLQFKDIDE